MPKDYITTLRLYSFVWDFCSLSSQPFFLLYVLMYYRFFMVLVIRSQRLLFYHTIYLSHTVYQYYYSTIILGTQTLRNFG